MTIPRILRVATALALAAALLVPASALALPANGRVHTPRANASRSTTATVRLAAKRAALRARIEQVLANRQRAFGAATAAISDRIGRVRAIEADIAAKLPAGTVVSFDGVNAELANAQATLDLAKATESAAAALFRAVPDAGSTAARRTAFQAAIAKAHDAQVQLVDARRHLRNAILQLESIVNSLSAVAQ